MKTQSQILLGVISAIAASAVIAFVAFRILGELQAESKRMEALDDILDKSHALHVLTAASREDSARSDIRQAREILSSLHGLLKISSRVPREQILIDHLEKSCSELGPLIDTWYDSGRPESDVERGRREMLASQVWIKAQFIADDTQRLMDISQARVVAAEKKTTWIIVALFVLLALTNAAIYWVSMRSIVRAQRAVRESEERLRFSLESCEIGAWDMDLENHTAYRSLEHDRIFGYQELLPSWTLADFLKHALPEYREPVEKMVREATAAKTGWSYECQIRRGDGEVRWVWFSGQHRTDSSGRSRVAGVVQDITERKRAQEALRASEERYRMLHESIRDAFVQVDMEGRIIAFNDIYCQMLGYSPEEVRRLTYHEITPERWHESEQRIVREQIIPRGYSDVYEKEYRRKDGTVFPVELRTILSRNPAGEPASMWGIVREIGERKRAQEALRASEERLRLALDAGRMVAWEYDPATLKVILSENAEQVLELPRRHENSDQGYGLIHPEDVERHRALVAKAIATGGSYVSQYRHAQAGRAVWLEEHGRALLDSAGKAVRLVGVVQNITERKQAAEALRASEARWNAAIENFAEGAIIATEAEEVIYWNPAARRMHGFKSPEEGIQPLEETPKTFELWTPDGSHLLVLDEWPMRRIKRGEKVRDLELRLRRPDQGWERMVSYSGAMLDTAGGERLIFLSVHDLTEQRAAERSLRESEERFRVAQELSPDGFTILRPVRDEHGHVVDFTWVYENDAASRVTGTDPKTMVGRRLLEVFPAHRGSEFLKAYQSVAETGESRVLESFYGDEKIAPKWFRVAVVPVGGDIAVLSQDVTRQKEFQAELERLVAERTAKLQELVGELEHFSYTITHDLKSPLRAMRGFSEVVQQIGVEAEAKPFLEKISAAAERMDRLIADALSYSRSVRQELPLEDVDAAALLRGMLDSYPELQPEKARIVVDGRLPVVLANQAGLTQCLSNLLGNAVKFVKAGEKPDIRVWATGGDSETAGPAAAKAPRSGWVRIWVEDRGIGISKEMLPRVFDMFARGSKKYDGTGIGLALVRKVVQRMGGKVGVDSEDGKWSRFWIELKSGEVSPVFAQSASRQGESVGAGTVLYVEDEEGDAMFMERAFAKKGLGDKLRLVATGRAAIDYLSGAGEFADRVKHPIPTLVLLDLNLPQVSGSGVLEWIRNNSDFSRLPVVVFSSSTRDDDRAKARELGADDFVTKPSSGLEFDKVVELLQQKWVERRTA